MGSEADAPCPIRAAPRGNRPNHSEGASTRRTYNPGSSLEDSNATGVFSGATAVGSGQQETNMSLDNTSHPGRAGPDELVPSRYALRVGEIDVLVVSDGFTTSCSSATETPSRVDPAT